MVGNVCVYLHIRLLWKNNAQGLYKKEQIRLHLLRRVRSLGVQGTLLRIFYDSVVISAIFCRVVCWSSSIDG